MSFHSNSYGGPFSWMHQNNEIIYNNTPYMVTTRQHDETFVNQWLASRKQPINKKLEKCRIPDVRESFKKVLNTCEKISNLEKMLRDNVASEADWTKNMEQILELKKKISNEPVLNDQELHRHLKKKLSNKIGDREHRKNKRSALKRKKQKEKKDADMKIKQIDLDLQRMQEELEKKKKKEELKIVLDNVLKDVTKRKAAARRHLSVLDSLLNLRSAREKSARGRGEKVNIQMSTEFVNNIEKLKNLWNSALNKYTEEENDLRNKLCAEDASPMKPLAVSCAVNDVTDNMEEKHAKLWKSVLFGGEDKMPHRNFKGNVHHFISVRKQWDQYILSDIEQASPLLVGWVLPPNIASSGWSAYKG